MTVSGRHATLLSNLAIPLLGAISGVLLARALGPADRGVFALVQTLPIVVATVASLGMAEALAFHVARESAAGRQHSLLRSALAIVALATAVTVGVLLAISPWTFSLAGREYRGAFLAAAFYIPALTFGFVAQGWYRGLNRIPLWNLSRLLPGLLWTIGVAAVFVSGPSVFRMALALSISGIVALFVYAVLGRADLKSAKTARGGTGRSLIEYGFPSTLSTFPRLVNLRFDQLFLLAFLPKDDVGLYVAAVAWASLIPAVASAQAMNSFPTIAALDPAERWEPARAVLLRGFKLASIVGAFLALLSPFVFPVLFGDEFRDGRAIAAAMSLVGIALALMTITTNLLWACGLPKRLLLADLSALVATVLLLVLLAPVLGVWAAVAASAVSYMAATSIGAFFIRRSSKEIDTVSKTVGIP